ncbi:MAG: methionine--tRNA ligase [Candidatus Moraniibacteriota bacterium]
MKQNKFYITTPIYYANASPHIGHAYTTIAADVLARWHRLQGDETFLLTGMDEHGAKIQKKAAEVKKDPQKFVDEISVEFEDIWKKLNVQYNGFIRTTSEKHKKAVQKVLQTLYDKGAIYKGEYEGLYCVGCEQFLNESDLVDGKCPDHNTVPEKMKEECYLLKMTEMQEKLIEKIKKDEMKISPERYKNEILSFLENQELKDISISRKNVSWGISLPFDDQHTTYVWVDAFLNYLTGLGWDGDEKNIPKEWPVDINLIGKDILRVHATIWPAILLHLGIELPKMIFTHGHILSGGKKMSKTLGNVISPQEMIEKFGTDGTRYLLLSAGTFGEDVDMTMERMVEKYNADLANGLGNLVSRVLKLSEKSEISYNKFEYKIDPDIAHRINKMGLGVELNKIIKMVSDANKYMGDTKPWELVKDNQESFNEVMKKLFIDLFSIAFQLEYFMPETSEKIKKAIDSKKLEEVLFQRIK